MATTTFHGKDGTATWGDSIINIIDWTVKIDADVVDVDYMGIPDDAKIRHVGHYRWTATINCYQDDSTAWTANPVTSAAASSPTSLVITAITGVSYTGNAWCTGANPTGDVNGVPAVSFTFTGSEDLTILPE